MTLLVSFGGWVTVKGIRMNDPIDEDDDYDDYESTGWEGE